MLMEWTFGLYIFALNCAQQIWIVQCTFFISQCDGVIPAVERARVVEQLMLYDRAAIESERIKDDILLTLEHFFATHACFVQAITRESRAGHKALLIKNLLQLRYVMLEICQVAKKNSINVIDMPAMPENILSTVTDGNCIFDEDIWGNNTDILSDVSSSDSETDNDGDSNHDWLLSDLQYLHETLISWFTTILLQ